MAAERVASPRQVGQSLADGVGPAAKLPVPSNRPAIAMSVWIAGPKLFN